MDIENIINRYLSKSTSEEENILLLEWLEEKEENRKFFKRSYDIWLLSNASFIDDNDVEIALSRLKERISPPKKEKRQFHIPHIRLMRIAISILLLLTTGYIGYKIGENKNYETITYNHLLTGADGKGEYLLPDSSIVWLNANSVLKYPEVFTDGKRVVQLEGEGLFEVKKDKNNPFFVETQGMSIEVTGTRFLVNNYPKKDMIEAVLVNGSVKISGDYFTDTQEIKPGEILSYNKQTLKTDLHKVNTDDYTNWIHSKLVFDKTNLEQVIINLEKWFNIEIVATAELTRNIHMSFTIRRESLEEVLTYMSLTTPIDYKWKDDVLYLFSKK